MGLQPWPVAWVAARARCGSCASLTRPGLAGSTPVVAGDSACQIFHHASPIPGSRIHRLASAVGQRIRISQRSDAEGFVLHARAAAHTGTQVLVHMWDSPERPCEAKLRLSDSVSSGARPP